MASRAVPALPTSLPPQLPPFSSQLVSITSIQRLALLHTTIPNRPRVDIITYTVEKDDTIFGIAEKFGLKPETILWGNYAVLRDDPHNLTTGQELKILP